MTFLQLTHSNFEPGSKVEASNFDEHLGQVMIFMVSRNRVRRETKKTA